MQKAPDDTSSGALVRVTGVEPARHGHQILSLARLPIPPYPQDCSAKALLTFYSGHVEKSIGCALCSRGDSFIIEKDPHALRPFRPRAFSVMIRNGGAGHENVRHHRRQKRRRKTDERADRLFHRRLHARRDPRLPDERTGDGHLSARNGRGGDSVAHGRHGGERRYGGPVRNRGSQG